MTGIPEGDIREHENTKKNDGKPAQHSSSSTLNHHPASLPVTSSNLVPPNLMAHGLMRPPHHLPNIPPPPFMMPPPIPGMPPFPMPAGVPLPGTVQPPLPLNPAVISRTPQLDLVKRAAAAAAQIQPPLPTAKAPLFPAAIASAGIPLPAGLPPPTSGIALPPSGLPPSTLNNDLSKTDPNKTNGTAFALSSGGEPVAKIVSPPNGKIIHPEEDLSLEELRARLPKYSQAKLTTVSLSGLQMLGNNHQYANPPPLMMSNPINNYTRSYTNDNSSDSISQPCYTTPVNDHSRGYHYRKS